MNGTFSRFLRIIPLIIVLLTALTCPASAEDYFQNEIKKANSGNIEAQANLGFAYYIGMGVPQDYAEGVKWLRMAAEQGHVESQYMLGDAYYRGTGVPQDAASAAKWYRKSAEQGHVESQYMLGDAYYRGEGVPQDYAEWVMWNRKAADQGLARAQYNLGVAYSTGKGVKQDFLLAYHWLSLSASRSNDEDNDRVVELRDRIARKLSPEQITKAQEMTRDWEEKHPRK